MILLLIFIWPIILFFYHLFKYFTYVDIELPCGSFKVRRMFRYDMNVMTRIVSKEVFSGGNVDDEVMRVLYMKYGPIFWQCEGGFIKQLIVGWVLKLKRLSGYKRWYESKWYNAK